MFYKFTLPKFAGKHPNIYIDLDEVATFFDLGDYRRPGTTIVLKSGNTYTVTETEAEIAKLLYR